MRTTQPGTELHAYAAPPRISSDRDSSHPITARADTAPRRGQASDGCWAPCVESQCHLGKTEQCVRCKGNAAPVPSTIPDNCEIGVARVHAAGTHRRGPGQADAPMDDHHAWTTAARPAPSETPIHGRGGDDKTALQHRSMPPPEAPSQSTNLAMRPGRRTAPMPALHASTA